MRTTSRFEKGSGCFKCAQCGKQTRSTGDNGPSGLCPLCYEIGTMENSLSDNGYGKHGDLEKCKTIEEARVEYTRLTEAARAKCEGCGGTGEVQVDQAPNGSYAMEPCPMCQKGGR